jgi:hypothetical protein
MFVCDCWLVNGTATRGDGDVPRLRSVIGGGDPWRGQFHFGDKGAFIDPLVFQCEELPFFTTPEVIETEP